MTVAPIVTKRWRNEAEFQRWVTDTFKHHGWRCLHVPTPMRPISNGRFVPDARGRGLPDLLLLHSDPPRCFWAECKAVDGVMSDAQIEVLGLLRAVCDETAEMLDGPSPFRVFVFQPGSEALIEQLARGAPL